MELAEFKKSAAFIAKRNVSERVAFVLATFDSGTGNLQITYCTDAEPDSEDWDDCELTCSEIIAEFPDVVRAETLCCQRDQCIEHAESIVFVRS